MRAVLAYGTGKKKLKKIFQIFIKLNQNYTIFESWKEFVLGPILPKKKYNITGLVSAWF